MVIMPKVHYTKWSCSERSIFETELLGLKNTGTERNYHRNMRMINFGGNIKKSIGEMPFGMTLQMNDYPGSSNLPDDHLSKINETFSDQ